ncbi:hypothetical protein BAZMOX_14658_0 [methanotrophic endosymbiont of Bathymodiolus azoricus (Menez Gwen)]|nr:hypothetical protein BAZMOX_14658_0 [methanotrophic endosymbiont of Bathymodiolus azoricus (Menez Gwen)]
MSPFQYLRQIDETFKHKKEGQKSVKYWITTPQYPPKSDHA